MGTNIFGSETTDATGSHAKLQAIIDEGAKEKIKQLRLNYAEDCAGLAEERKKEALESLSASRNTDVIYAAIHKLMLAAVHYEMVDLLMDEEE
jgi:hypothetical protein